MNCNRYCLPAIVAILLVMPLSSWAAPVSGEWRAVQGEVVEIHMHKLPAGPVHLYAFHRDWTTKRQADGSVLSWIGIDLAQKPGRYTLVWHIGKGAKSEKKIEHLTINKGSFRISRITVSKKMAVFNPKTLARVLSDERTVSRTYRMVVNASPDIRMKEWPVKGPISSPFGARRYVNGEPRSPHTGVDIAAPKGTPIHAPLAGRVLLVKSMYLDGNTIVLGHGNGLVSVYCHLSRADVKKGQWVKTGAVIGEVGMSGRTTGPNLHWGVRFENARVDPTSMLPPEANAIALGNLR